jgi:lysozyme
VGHAYTDPNGKPLQAGQAFSDDVCSYLLGQDTAKAQAAVKALVRVPLSTGENLAYTDFVFNVGSGNFARSGIRRNLNAGRRQEACKGLLAWVYAGGKELAPLRRRRQAEEKACLAGDSYK